MQNEINEPVPMLVCTQPPVISENLMDLQERVNSITEMIIQLPKEPESVPQVKKARADLRKYFDSLEEQRKAVKAAVMAPYNEAEAKYKALVSGPIQQADKLCKDFVDGVELSMKQECESGLREYFEELRAAKAELAAEVKALRIRLSRVESIAKTASRSELRFVAPLTDTMLVGMADSCPQRLLTWRDAWTEVRGCIRRDSAEVSILSRDTLVQIVHRVPHRWWFFRWGTRAIRQEVVSRNPHTQLVYTEYLRLE